MSQTFPLLEKDKPCLDEPCLLGGTHVPAIDFDVNHFVGVSEYWHTTHEIFEMSDVDKAYDFKTYQTRVNDFCSQPWAEIEKGITAKKWGKKVDESTAEAVCFKASWLINMLHDGIGIPRVGLEMKGGKTNTTKHLIESAKSKGFLDPFQAVNKIEGTEVSWTLGKMVLYASSQIPPAENAMAVGFGSNTPGVTLPTDFQHPGGKEVQTSDDLTDSTQDAEAADETDWHDTLFRDSTHRLPGLLLFMLIICVVVFFLCGRERRAALYTKLRTLLFRRKRGGASTGRFGKYDRVVDDPEASAAGEFELPPYEVDSGDEHSDDTEGTSSSRAGKAPGWATPTLSVPVGDVDGSPNKRGYFGDASGLGLGPAWTAGLMARTDSRERLSPGAGRSRAGSPTRRSPNLGLVKESVD